MNTTRALTISILVLLGCDGGGQVDTTAPDGGANDGGFVTINDAGLSGDARAPADIGTPTDARAQPDSGIPTDARPQTDAISFSSIRRCSVYGLMCGIGGLPPRLGGPGQPLMSYQRPDGKYYCYVCGDPVNYPNPCWLGKIDGCLENLLCVKDTASCPPGQLEQR